MKYSALLLSFLLASCGYDLSYNEYIPVPYNLSSRSSLVIKPGDAFSTEVGKNVKSIIEGEKKGYGSVFLVEGGKSRRASYTLDIRHSYNYDIGESTGSYTWEAPCFCEENNCNDSHTETIYYTYYDASTSGGVTIQFAGQNDGRLYFSNKVGAWAHDFHEYSTLDKYYEAVGQSYRRLYVAIADKICQQILPGTNRVEVHLGSMEKDALNEAMKMGEEGAWPSADNLVKSVLSESPDDIEANALMTLMDLRFNRYEEAMKHVAKSGDILSKALGKTPGERLEKIKNLEGQWKKYRSQVQ